MSIAGFRPNVRVARRSSRQSSRRSSRQRSARLALIVWWRGTDLDQRLAAGEDPWATDELMLRARRLTSLRSRTRVANGLAGVLRSAANSGPRFTAAVRPRAPEVDDAGAVIASIERRLRSPGPVAAQGMALIRLLLIDGNGPLYQSSDPDTLSNLLQAAAAALAYARD